MAIPPFASPQSITSLRLMGVLAWSAASVILVGCGEAPASPAASTDTAPPATAPLERSEPDPVTATVFKSFGDDITRGLPPGDPGRGEALFGPQGEFCTGCHSQLMVGPPLTAYEDHPAIAERAAATIEDSTYAGQATTVTEYLVESIVRPSAYVVPGFPDGNMPNNFGFLLSPQDISDLVAYMLAVQ